MAAVRASSWSILFGVALFVFVSAGEILADKKQMMFLWCLQTMAYILTIFPLGVNYEWARHVRACESDTRLGGLNICHCDSECTETTSQLVCQCYSAMKKYLPPS